MQTAIHISSYCFKLTEKNKIYFKTLNSAITLTTKGIRVEGQICFIINPSRLYVTGVGTMLLG